MRWRVLVRREKKQAKTNDKEFGGIGHNPSQILKMHFNLGDSFGNRGKIPQILHATKTCTNSDRYVARSRSLKSSQIRSMRTDFIHSSGSTRTKRKRIERGSVSRMITSLD
jgi:hypothetical protein